MASSFPRGCPIVSSVLPTKVDIPDLPKEGRLADLRQMRAASGRAHVVEKRSSRLGAEAPDRGAPRSLGSPSPRWTMAVDPIEEWLGTRLKAAYPVDDWVLEGVTSALLLLEDRADAIDTIANFLGVADAPGTNEQIVDELFRRKRRDTAGAGAGGAQSHASESVPSSAGPSRDASSARARATSSSAGGGTRVDVAEKTRSITKQSGGDVGELGGVSEKTTPRRPLRPEELAKPDINCLSCGKIYRCAPRDGALAPEARAFLKRGCACLFCGGAVVVVLADGAEMAGPADETLASPRFRNASRASKTIPEKTPSSSGEKTLEARPSRGADPPGAAAAAARDAKDRLVAFDRTAAARTTVIDDQSDWFEIESNAWLDEDEREEAKRQAMEVEEAREAAAKNRATRVTLDLLGRRVDDASSRRVDALADDAKHAGSGFVLRETHIADTHIGAVSTNALNPEPPGPGAGGASGASSPARDPRRVLSNPTAGFAPVFSSALPAGKKKGKKDTDVSLAASRGGGGRIGGGTRVQDESPFDVVARETEA